MLLLVEGKKGSTLNKLRTNKDDKISPLERIEHMMKIFELDPNMRDDAEFFEDMKNDSIKLEEYKADALESVKNTIFAHFDSVIGFGSFKDWLSFVFGNRANRKNKNLDGNADTNIDIDDYDNLNTENISKYLKSDTLGFGVSTDNMDIIFGTYISMMEAVSKKWLEFVVDYAKIKKYVDDDTEKIKEKFSNEAEAIEINYHNSMVEIINQAGIGETEVNEIMEKLDDDEWGKLDEEINQDLDKIRDMQKEKHAQSEKYLNEIKEISMRKALHSLMVLKYKEHLDSKIFEQYTGIDDLLLSKIKEPLDPRQLEQHGLDDESLLSQVNEQLCAVILGKHNKEETQ
jgi:hypothetical protein